MTASASALSAVTRVFSPPGLTSMKWRKKIFLPPWMIFAHGYGGELMPLLNRSSPPVNGYALGAGCELALLCDLIVAGDNARFGLPEITLGIMPGAGGTQRLIRSVGKALASRMVLSGESIDARQAQQAGLVSDIHPAALTDEYALQLATTIARHSPLALRAAKQSLRLSQEVSLQAGLQQERQLFSLLSATEDRREGIDAFLQKRTPEFKGR
ncbi:phenylacetate degradation enoyl-CoA hydratase PaaA [Klebsiella pneumoniae]|nr:phenylacetate degradation enoyl-CoA hydratase PaaA [Klebsiella pneumoniae]